MQVHHRMGMVMSLTLVLSSMETYWQSAWAQTNMAKAPFTPVRK
jgi:hypothetical protein